MQMLHTDARKRIAEARWKAGFSRRQLAERSGISETTIFNIERGVAEPLPQTIYVLAGALNLNPEDLLEPEEAAS